MHLQSLVADVRLDRMTRKLRLDGDAIPPTARDAVS